MNLGFLVCCDQRGVKFQTFGAAPKGLANLLSQASNAVAEVLFLGRLYYREESALRVGGDVTAETTYAELVLATYQKGGTQALSRLEGDYALVVWDVQRRVLLATRDPFGGFPLFWCRDGAAVAVSTGMKPLLEKLPRRRINLEYLGDYLMLPGCGVQELHSDQCVYEGIHRVQAGTRLEVTTDGKVRSNQWWNWEEQICEPVSLDPEEIAGRFRELLSRAVQERRVGVTAAHLSGGMDSTAVALLAAQQAVQTGTDTVHALTLVYPHFQVLSREAPYIQSALERPGLTWHPINGEDLLSFDGFREDINPDEPAVPLWHSTVSRAELDRACEVGAQTLMTGFGADELVCVPPYHIHDLVRRGHWPAAWSEATRWACAHSCSRWAVLGPYALIYFLPAGLRAGVATWWRNGRVTWEQQSDGTIAPWVRPQTADRLRLRERAIQRLQRQSMPGRPLAQTLALEMMNLSVGDAVRWELGVPRGVMPVHPYRDLRLVRYCLSLRGRLWPEPDRQKPILADAMRDVLPETIRRRRGKGHFNEVFYRGLSRNVSLLESLIHKAPEEFREMFDSGELIRCLHKAALGIGQDSRGADRLTLTLGWLKWLTLQEPTPDISRLHAMAMENAKYRGAAVGTKSVRV